MLLSHRFVLLIIYIYICQTCIAQSHAQPINTEREMRAAWVATVENIDWPSSKKLTADQQQNEFKNIVSRYADAGFNALFVQIRPCADAFYPSPYEPWSNYLTGVKGKDPGYDPLKFMIDECHRQGLEFHAWFNPYRAIINISYDRSDISHITKLKPEWFITYGNIKLFNPGLPEVWVYIKEIVMDVVKKYDIDGVHLDDYFYPYKIHGKPFPDQKTYNIYNNGMSLDNWRRQNVDTVIHILHDAIAKEKPYIRFGVSPFGVWRNKHIDGEGSATRAGCTNFDDLYADILKWLKNDWIDYAAPQLYWETGNRLCDYYTLAQWWNDHSYGRHIYIGHASYRLFEKTPSWCSSNQICTQVKTLRNHENLQGSIFYNTNSMMKNPHHIMDSLRLNYYSRRCLAPLKQGFSIIRIEKPVIKSYDRITKTALLDLNDSTLKNLRFVVVYNQNLIYKVTAITQFIQTDAAEKNSITDSYKISYVDKFGRESEGTVVE
ncbi:MAG: family 10 glycosylhydrolase [Bacteroidota bacterium]|nr:family 10 glycosylhydrolase [Bacteroidota bacterium]